MVTGTQLIQDFVNTLHKDVYGDEEELQTPTVLAAWLRDRGLAGAARATVDDLARAIELREALRTLLLANNGVAVDAAAAQRVLDEAARRGRIELRFLDGEPTLVPAATGVAGALGRVVAAVHASFADGSWPRLKACRAHDCEWAFVDHAKNQSRAWCSMRSCGNRAKARAHRERQRHA
ncbi:MAG TPA: CGNR zinc finger domain-containing protein [Gaiellaceae bacterium]|nr:CGNR zinc finger domain-containing protein [Gaiellaceae bacterium]